MSLTVNCFNGVFVCDLGRGGLTNDFFVDGEDGAEDEGRGAPSDLF